MDVTALLVRVIVLPVNLGRYVMMHTNGTSHPPGGRPATTRRSTSNLRLNRKTRRCAIWTFAAVLPAALILAVCLAVLLPRHDRDHGGGNNNNDDGGTGGGNGNGNSDGGGFDTYPASAYPSPSSIRGTIPHNARPRTLDPSLVRRRSDGKLFLYTTGGRNCSIWTADAVRGPWTKIAGPGSDSDATGPGAGALAEQCGAPQVYGPLGSDGAYYLVHNSHMYDYAREDGVSDPEATRPWHDASLAVQSSRTLEPGSWRRHGRLEIPWSRDYNVLDGALLSVPTTGNGNDDNNENILAFGSYQAGIYALPLADPPTRLADGAMRRLAHLQRNASAAVSSSPRGRTEAAFLYARGRWTYLFFSAGRCCPHRGGRWPARRAGDVYRVMVCRRPSGAPWWGGGGGSNGDDEEDFVDKEGRSCRSDDGGTEILASHGGIWAPGGQGVLEDDGGGGEGGVLLYYHYVPFDQQAQRPGKGFRFGWNRLEFGDAG
ncbi:hypothetical protein DL763_008198 [Monosporascus cannonballus]|nr:hypothetical protein DL763_008198 [Monosporascus cannonballus]